MFSFLAIDLTEVVENAMGSSLSDILIQIGATLILVLVVKLFLWDSIMQFLEKRRNIMEEELSSAKAANEEAQAFQDKTDKEYHKLKAQSKDILRKARDRGEEERDIIVGKAREEANELLNQAHQEIALEKKKAESDIRKEAVDLAALMASKIIEKEIDEKAYQDLSVDKIESSEKL